MNADAFRRLYDYHFTENRKIWNEYIVPLTQEQFTQPVAYSIGSVRNQIVHLINVEDIWFSQIRGIEEPPSFSLDDVDDRETIRKQADAVERDIRQYLEGLRDDMLFQKPFAEGEDKDLILWQVLLHVVNHGTDHRAQLLRLLNDLGVQTKYQDYIFYTYANP